MPLFGVQPAWPRPLSGCPPRLAESPPALGAAPEALGQSERQQGGPSRLWAGCGRHVGVLPAGLRSPEDRTGPELSHMPPPSLSRGVTWRRPSECSARGQSQNCWGFFVKGRLDFAFLTHSGCWHVCRQSASDPDPASEASLRGEGWGWERHLAERIGKSAFPSFFPLFPPTC